MKHINGLFEFIRKSPTAYHAVDEVIKKLCASGYTELSMAEEWVLEPGRGYYVTANGSSLIAFRSTGKHSGYMITASHSDSPTFKIKPAAEKTGVYTRLDVEKYGGMIYYTWLDRPLSVAGRYIYKAKSGELKVGLADLDTDLVTVPSLAIHLNRGVNEGAKFNPAEDLLPLYMTDGGEGSLIEKIAEKAGISPSDIISHDLSLYNRDEGKVFGGAGEFILSPRLDDLACVYASTEAFLAESDGKSVPVLCIFDNEEVGSSTKQGAASGFLYDVLGKISGDKNSLLSHLSCSFMVSADNAHAVHPAHPEMSDKNNAPKLGGGIVIKYNANQRYTTDGVSDAIFRTVCERAKVKVQTYCNRADLPGGSTLGSISNTRVAVPTVDIGLPQLAMHSANETAAVTDLRDMVAVLKEFYKTSLKKTNSGYEL